jgi:mannose-6-phosphate isomerase-like protein (cupin superfamily)
VKFPKEWTVIQAGQTLYNPVTGERLTILQTTEQTGGHSLLFEIVSGTVAVIIGDDKVTLRPGDRAVLPPKVKHQWWNAGEEEAVFRVQAVPARNLEQMLEAICGLAQAGKLNRKAMPRNPFYLVNIGRLSESYMPGLPIWFQKIGLSMGSITGRLLGVDPTLRAYRELACEQATGEALATSVA